MKHAVGLGLQDFERVIEEKICYVDKTRFISEWWNGNDEVTLITRPRRLGKTLMMSTVENFFSNCREALWRKKYILRERHRERRLLGSI